MNYRRTKEFKDRVKRLQRAVGVDDDGVIGNHTLTAFESVILSQEVEHKDVDWVKKAFEYLGEKEIRGKGHNPKIVGFWNSIRIPWIRDDETPWCAAFVGAVLEMCGIVSTRKGNARSYMKWGRRISAPAVGCVVVFWRGKKKGWKGHVGFVVGQDKRGNLLVLGGNQGNAVTVKAYLPATNRNSRVLGYFWPKGQELPKDFNLPLGEAKASNGNEA